VTTDHVTLLSPLLRCVVVVLGCVALDYFVKLSFILYYTFNNIKEIELYCFLGVLSSIL